MKKFSIKNRIIAAILSVITVISVGTMAMVNASAAGADDVTAVNYNNYPCAGQNESKLRRKIAVYLLLEQLTKEIGSRGDYCKKYQSGVSNFLLALMDDVNALTKDELLNLGAQVLLSEAVSSVPGFKDLAREAIKKALPEDVDAEKAVDSIDPLLDVIGDVYWERPNELISLGLYIKEVFQNHDNGVNIAHLEAQDSYYISSLPKSFAGFSWNRRISRPSSDSTSFSSCS